MLLTEKRATLDSEGVLAVEDWAEIRRLHLPEGLSARAVSRRLGVSRGAVARALAAGGAAEVGAQAGGVGSRLVRAGDPGAVGGVPVDAGVGDRRAGRLE